MTYQIASFTMTTLHDLEGQFSYFKLLKIPITWKI